MMNNNRRHWPSHVGVLNEMMDPIDILTDTELQSELSLYANAQFTFDTLPGTAIEEKQAKVKTLSSFDMYHHPRGKQHRPPTLDTTLVTPEEPLSSTASSPYELQHSHQHYFTPISSLPGSPTRDGLSQSRHMDQLLSYMMLSPTETSELHPPSYPVNDLVPAADSHEVSPESFYKKPAKTARRHNLPAASRLGKKGRPGGYHSKIEQSDILETNSSANDDDMKELGDNVGIASKESNNGDASVDNGSAKLDKRRRNTAASARFRIKKKIREQSLQRTACEMTEKAKRLEIRVHELEREIKWLKELVVAKNG